MNHYQKEYLEAKKLYEEVVEKEAWEDDEELEKIVDRYVNAEYELIKWAISRVSENPEEEMKQIPIEMYPKFIAVALKME